jgi:hypothetical protein
MGEDMLARGRTASAVRTERAIDEARMLLTGSFLESKANL